MTEEEAKTKWCPHAGTSTMLGTISLNILLINRDHAMDGVKDAMQQMGTKCYASDCMMWRWGLELHREGEAIPLTAVDKDGHILHGYCGLAGKPLADQSE